MSNNQARPLVIVTGPDKRWRFGWWATHLMLSLAGLRAHYVTPVSRRIPPGVKGVIIGGGDDIKPEHYGLTGDAGACYDPQRDQLEMTVVKDALTCGVPLLGICRGAQLINVVLGGTLHTDLRPLRRHTPNRNSIFPVKSIDVFKHSDLYQYLGEAVLKVNSLHNQAVDRIGTDLRVTARDQDGFVQGIESSAGSYIQGVQWHPEYMPYSIYQKRLFRGFASAVNATGKTLSIQQASEINA